MLIKGFSVIYVFRGLGLIDDCMDLPHRLLGLRSTCESLQKVDVWSKNNENFFIHKLLTNIMTL